MSVACEAFELAHVVLVGSARRRILVSLRRNVERYKSILHNRGIPEPVLAAALFLGACHARLPVCTDYPIKPRSLRDDAVGALFLLRAQALLYRGNLMEADDLVDSTMRYGINRIDDAVQYNSALDWHFDIMRRLSEFRPMNQLEALDLADTVH